MAKRLWRPKTSAAWLDRFTHHCDIVETGNESWRFRNRASRRRARAVTKRVPFRETDVGNADWLFATDNADLDR